MEKCWSVLCEKPVAHGNVVSRLEVDVGRSLNSKVGQVIPILCYGIVLVGIESKSLVLCLSLAREK